ncbi:N-6 DNA methylase [Synechococcus sp. HJ21-Hayes]|uniref:Eco57I restriction-modification methylase domain-containing protein n=1 Tax=unclassified Synechococcus TaxID=2626047 RepID=UPI0020CB8E40|nr:MULTISPECIES: DNA methyltransferase [unclassified Synechococcus]MCP9831473.1 N-6 DNA methylase [Synechococcus sp. JJ3a-Johnson]MCP9851636.1 N-6 DNA methylase [Synechococcus sp. HJ21-Hayes]
MPRRPSTTDPELLAHQQWLGYLQPVGLVVAPAAMQDAGWVVARSGSELIERQQRYRDGLEPLGGDDDDADERELGFTGIETLLVEQLGWGTDQVQSDPKLIEGYTRELPELGETLQPTAVVPVASGEGAQLLVQELPLLMPLDQKLTAGEHLWRASPQERFERLLRETGVEAGLLFNGAQLRLVVAPKGESSGYLTFPLADLAEVSGRLMFSGLDLLLGQSHVFLDPDGYRLSDVLKKSRSFQAVVSNALADQVLAALWDLLRGFQQADELSQRQDIELLGDLPERDAQQLYGGLITMLMRLVFLLYAEDEALMPSDAVYEQNYKLSGIYEQLQQDESEYPDTMEQRFGAWAGLMSLCRLVFDGGGPTADYLPARHGQLFDPAVYPWLESPWISDGVVLALLRNLLIVNGERISYRALDVEQIGSVYEGIMGYAVRRIPGRCIGLKSKPQGAKKQLTTAVDLDALLAMPGGKRKAWLEEEAGTTLPPKSATALKDASSEAELLEALAPRINRELFDGPQAAGGLVFQPTEERRRSGSHYTPRSLTRPIVEEALRPWLERCEHRPTAAQILDLKICDPAMGSGAFLVESCRFLAELLELAWNREGLPDALKPGGHAHGEEPLIYARRLIAQSCLYGVDKNPFAVNLARLSLWLVSLSKDAPFTFVDHALKCGDSLVGMERSEIEKAIKGASLQREIQMAYLDQVRQQEARSFALFHVDSRSDADDEQKRQALDSLNASTAYLRTVGDLLVAAFFNGKKPKDREALKNLYLEATLQHSSVSELEDELAEPLERLREGEKGIQPLHWGLAFPDVFKRESPGFDVFIGNPPYLGGRLIASALGDAYTPLLKSVLRIRKSSADLSVYFVARASRAISESGGIALITTKSIKEGDTRPVFQDILEEMQLSIFYATTSRLWPGDAGTSYVSFAMTRGAYKGPKLLDGISASNISSSLQAEDSEANPMVLFGKIHASRGITLMGEGFILSRNEEQEIIELEPKCRDVIKFYTGSEDMLNRVGEEFPRFCIDYGDMPENLASSYEPTFARLKALVKPSRDKLSKQIHEHCFWKHWDKRLDFFACLSEVSVAIVIPRVAKYMLLERHEEVRDKLYSDSVNVLACGDWEVYSALQSRVHEAWVNKFKSSRDARIIYNVKSCFRTFPLPRQLAHLPVEAPSASCLEPLRASGSTYYRRRLDAVTKYNEGLTMIYNRFHDPFETSCDLLELRRLHSVMDQAVLVAYGWSDVPTACGFGLDYFETEDNATLPDELQERIDSGELFFWDASDALDFQGQLHAHGAITGRRKLPWRYRWPDVVRDDVLARLLTLNAERYAEEVAQGLHGKGGKKAAPAAAGDGKRRGRPPKAALATDGQQIGLAL